MKSEADWELCKENIKPLKQGRNMANLQPAIQSDMMTDKNYTERLNHEKTQFEAKIRTYEGDDPFDSWYCYISWIEQNDPKGGKTKSLRKVMYESIMKFKDDTQYKNDPRFIEICLKSALMSKEPVEVFHFMYSENLGLNLALYFKSWARYLVSVGNLKDADAVITEGLSKNAQPKDELLLEQAHINKIAAQGLTERQADEEIEPQRTALGSLKPCGAKQQIGSTRTGLAKQNVKSVQHCDNAKLSKAQSTFIPFQDQNIRAPSKEFVKTKGIMIMEDNRENEMEPSKWTQVKMPAKVVLPPQAKFQVLIDPVANQTTKKVSSAKSGLSASKAKSDDDKFTLSTKKSATLKEVHMFCKDKLFCGNSEFQFEELRALKWKKDNQRVDRVAPIVNKQSFNSDNDQRIQKCENLQNTDALKQNSTSETGSAIMPSNKITISDQSRKVNMPGKDKSLIQQGFQVASKAPNKIQNDDLQLEVNKHVNQAGYSFINLLWNGTLSDPIDEFIKEGAHLLKDTPPERVYTSEFATFHDEEPPIFNFSNKNLPTHNIENRVESVQKPKAIFEVFQDNKNSNKLGSSNSFLPSQDLNEGCGIIQKPQTNFTVFSNVVEAPDLCLPNKILPTLAANECNKHIEKPKTCFTVYHDVEEVPELGLSNKILSTQGVNECREHIEKPKTCFTVYHDDEEVPELGLSNKILSTQGVNECREHIEKPKTCFTVYHDVEEVPELGLSNKILSTQGVNECQDNLDYGLNEDYSPELEKCLPREVLLPLNDLPTIRIYEIDNYNSDIRHKTAEVSMTYISNTAFLRNLNMGTSTPTKVAVNNFVKDNIKKPMVPINDKNKPTPINFEHEGNDVNQSTNFYRRLSFRGTNHVGLSPISETSREYKSSSSSGMSSTGTAASTVQRSRFLRTKIHDEPSTFSEKTIGSRSINFCVINPFDEALINDLLNNYLPNPLHQIPGYEFYHNSIPPISANKVIKLGSDKYKILGECGKGSFASVYIAVPFDVESEISIPQQNIIALKFQNPPCPWEFYISKQLMSRISQLKSFFDVSPSIMDVSKLYCFSNGSVAVTEFHAYGTLLHVVNFYKQRRQFMPECLVMYFTIEILEIIHQVHESRIIHADVKPDNFVLMELPSMHNYSLGKTFEDIFENFTQSIKLIDYGRSIDLTLFEPNVVFNHQVQTSGFMCPTMKENKPWTFQGDYFGIAGSIHIMLFGEYLVSKKSETKWEITSKFKRYWNIDVWKTIFDSFINIPDCDNQPNVPSMISMLKDALMTKKMLNDMPRKIYELYSMLNN